MLAFAEGLHRPEAMALDDRTEALSAALHLRPAIQISKRVNFWSLPLFERLQIGDQVFDLIRIEAKDRHRRVSDQNAFTKGFCKMSGRRPLIKGYFAALRLIVGAVMSSAC